MSDEPQPLPELDLNPEGNPPRVEVFAPLGKIVASGTLLLRKDERATFKVENLKYIVEFVEDPSKAEKSTDLSQPDPSSLIIRLLNFKSTLGTAVTNTRIGVVNGGELSILLHVQALGTESNIVTYTLYWSGPDGK